MATQKIIYWNPDDKDESGQTYANVHLLIGYYGTTITDFARMAKELRETFPQAKDSEIRCGRVFKSNQVNGFAIITWSQYLPEGDYFGWNQEVLRQYEYVW